MGLMCTNCGGRNTKCFIHSGVNPNQTDIYILLCNDCKEDEQKEIPVKSTGREIAPGVAEWQDTRCPFCGKSGNEHEGMVAKEPEDDGVAFEENPPVTLVFEEDVPQAPQGCPK